MVCPAQQSFVAHAVDVDAAAVAVAVGIADAAWAEDAASAAAVCAAIHQQLQLNLLQPPVAVVGPDPQ